MLTAIRFRAILTWAAGALAATACTGESPTDPVEPPIALQIVSGDQQQGIVGQELPAPLVVRVLDARGHPVRGQIVDFHVTVGGGSVYAGDGLTNASGIAQDYWTLGPEPGPNVLEVRAVDPTTGAKQNFGTFTATALPQTFVLQVSAAAGRVVSTPSGIDCGSDCSEGYVQGTVVSLTAIPDPGFLFVGWSGDCSGTATCSMTMDAPKTVSASFGAGYTVTVIVTGPGTVTSSPAGIACPAQPCSATFPAGTAVELQATPGQNAVLDGWSGGCSGTAATCSFTVGADVSVGASFTMPTMFLLSVGGANVRILSSPAGIDCGNDCSEYYASGTVVTLTVSVNPGFVFTGWAGDCTGTGVCTLTMDGARSVAALTARWP